MTLTPTKIRQQMAKKKATKKTNTGINWINSWSASNKSANKIEIRIRLGKFTLLQLETNKKFRLIIFNLGFEI
mgnify:CR=1 FL=1